MADINVERKSGNRALVWGLGILVLLVVAFLAWTFLAGGRVSTSETTVDGLPASEAPGATTVP